MIRLSNIQRGLLVLTLLLGVAYLYTSLVPARLPDVPMKAEKTQAPVPLAATAAFNPPAVQAFAEIDARPLFNPTRKPLAEPTAASVANIPPPPVNLTLVGIIMGPDRRIAVLKTPAGPASVNAIEGQTIGGWTLVRVEKDGVVLSAGGASQRLKLHP